MDTGGRATHGAVAEDAEAFICVFLKTDKAPFFTVYTQQL